MSNGDTSHEEPRWKIALRVLELIVAVLVMFGTFYAAVTSHDALQTARSANETATQANAIAMGFQHAVAVTNVSAPEKVTFERVRDFALEQPNNYLTIENSGKVPITEISLIVVPNNVFEPGVWARDESWRELRIPITLREELVPSGGVLVDLSPLMFRVLRSICPTLPAAPEIKGAMMVVVEAVRQGDTLPAMTGVHDRQEIPFKSSCRYVADRSLAALVNGKIYAQPIQGDLNVSTGTPTDR